MAGVIQVLEIENDRLKETNTALERQVDQHRSVRPRQSTAAAVGRAPSVRSCV